jgi:putative acetyltransferase
MSASTQVRIREFAPEDLEDALRLWSRTAGLGLNESDTHAALLRFLQRNPGCSAVAVSNDGDVVGAALCGHDGRRGAVHHVAVVEPYRRQGIAKGLLEHCLRQLDTAQIPRCNVYLYNDNVEGAKFWTHNGWEEVTTWRILQKRLP